MRAAATAVLLLVALAACGGDDDVEAGAPGGDTGDGATSATSTTTTTTVPPDTPVSNEPGPQVPVAPGGPERVEPRGGTANPQPIAFDPSEAEATDGGVLIRYYTGVAPCSVLDRYEVVETPETVMVTLYVGADPSQADPVCIELAQLYEVLVPLESPLGARQLVSGRPFG